MRALYLSGARPVARLAAGTEIWLANMRADPVEISVPGARCYAVPDTDCFAWAGASEYMDQTTGFPVVLIFDGFAVAHILIGD